MCRHVSSKHKQRFCFCAICYPRKENPNKISLTSILERKKNALKIKPPVYIFYCDLCQEIFINVINFNTHRRYCAMEDQNPNNKIVKQNIYRKKDPVKQILGHLNTNNVKKENGIIVLKSVPYIKVNKKEGEHQCTMKDQNLNNKMIKQNLNKTKEPVKQILGHPNINNVKKDDDKILVKSVPYISDNKKEGKLVRQSINYECVFCGKTFATQQTGLRHEAENCKKNVNNTKALGLCPCERCKKQFKSSENRKCHMKMYCYDKNLEMKIECTKCPKKFPSERVFRRHFLLRHARVYYCNYCQRSFNDKCHLVAHILGHMGIKPFKCNICGQKFSRQCELQLHLQRHSKKKDYSCNVCSKEFMFKNILEKHTNLNCSEENIRKYPYLCDICKKRYENKTLIEKHMMNVHVNKFPCYTCDKVYGLKYKLEEHRKRNHGKSVTCNICKKTLCTKYDLISHKKSHLNYSCIYYRHRTSKCPKTAGKPMAEIIKNDVLLSKIDTQTKTVKAKKKYGSIKITQKVKKDEVYGDKNNKTGEGKNIRGNEASITGQDSTHSEDNYCLKKFPLPKPEKNSSNIEINENNKVVRDIKKILRKRKNRENSSHGISKKYTLTNEHKKMNDYKNSSNTNAITTRTDDYFKQKYIITKNVKIILNKIH